MNHPAVNSVKWTMLIIGIGLLLGVQYFSSRPEPLLYFIGSVFALTGAVIVLITAWLNGRTRSLLRKGTLVQADFQQVEINTSFKLNGVNPFRIVAQWHDVRRNEVRIFRSANLWFDPSSFVGGRRITVYIDPDNPARYHMDLSFLPKVTGLV